MLQLVIRLSLNSVATQSKPNKPKLKLKLFSARTVVTDNGIGTVNFGNCLMVDYFKTAVSMYM